MLQPLLPKILEQGDPSFQTVEELFETLSEAINEGKIKNIALTGPFGSGKSSILQTLRKNHGNFDYLPISLATLQADGREDEVNGEGEEPDSENREKWIENLNRKIEYSILQQLIYREKATTIPNSRFRRIIHIDRCDITKYAFGGVTFIVAFLIAFEPTWLRVESVYNALNFGKVNVLFDFLAVSYMLFALFEVTKYVIKSYSNSKLNKLNLKDGEIELKEENSIFNKHLDEILYFFQVTKYNVVVIEDLDRFGTSNIFLKLRELNLLINESKIVGRNVAFLYAIKDDVFDNEERTKFFDYITTVIPVINPSNSKDKLRTALIERGCNNNEITDGDLADMAFFIQDMRILTNIANEYYQYKQKLCTANDQKLNSTKLLAMIIYKNYHPKDFAQLHRRAGKVYNCISSKSKFVQKTLETIAAKEKELENEYKLYLDNKHSKEKELRLLFLCKLVNNINRLVDSIHVNENYYSIDAIAGNSNLFNSLLSKDTFDFQYPYGYGEMRTAKNTAKYAEIDKALNYTNRMAVLKESEKTFSNRKAMIQKERLKIHSSTLKAIISKYKLGETEQYTQINLSPMMDVFIRRGFIDEEYYDYISYFYEGMVSLTDRDLLLSIRREMKQDYTYHIDKVQNFVKELQPYMFESDAILNNDLLNYLAKEEKKFSDFFNLIMYRLEIENSPLDFFAQYYLLGKEPQKVFKHYINWDRTKSWDNIELWPNVNEKNVLREGWLKFCGQLDSKQKIWLKHNYDFISSRVNNIGLIRCKQLVEECYFEKLNEETTELLQHAIDECSYVINVENLCLITSFLHNSDDSIITNTNLNLSRIKSTGNQTLIDYIEDNIAEALSCFSNTCKDELPDSILLILNSNELTETQKAHYLIEQQNLLDDCTNITSNELITLGYKLFLIKPTWENVTTYFNNEDKSFDVLIQYVDKFAEKLGKEKIDNNESQKDIFEILLGSNRLSFEAYQLILNSFNLIFNGLNTLAELDLERLNLLLINRKLPFNENNTAVIKNTSVYVDYLLYHSSIFYSQKETSYFCNIDVTQRVLSSSKFTDIQKKELVMLVPESMMLNSQPLADIIIEILVKTDYSILNESTLKSLIQITKEKKNRVMLVTTMIANIDYDEVDIADVLGLLNGKYQEIAERSKRPVIDNTDWNITLVSTLVAAGFISSYKNEKDGIRVIPKKVK